MCPMQYSGHSYTKNFYLLFIWKSRNSHWAWSPKRKGQDYSHLLCDVRLTLLYIPRGYTFMSIILLILKEEKEEKYQDFPELSYCIAMMMFFGIRLVWLNQGFFRGKIVHSFQHLKREIMVQSGVSWDQFQPGHISDPQGTWQAISSSPSLSLSLCLCLSSLCPPFFVCFCLNLYHFQLVCSISSPKFSLLVVLNCLGPTSGPIVSAQIVCDQRSLTSNAPFVSGPMFAKENLIGYYLNLIGWRSRGRGRIMLLARVPVASLLKVEAL